MSMKSKASKTNQERAVLLPTLPLGSWSMLVGLLTLPMIGAIFCIDQLTQTHIRSDAYGGAGALGVGLALVGEAITLVGSKLLNLSTDGEAFFDLKDLSEYPQGGFNDCFFYRCEFVGDVSKIKFERCYFVECIFKSESVIDDNFVDCHFTRSTFIKVILATRFFWRNGFISVNLCCATLKVKDLDASEVGFEAAWIGELSCFYNARSPHLRCALNLNGTCDGCKDYESIFSQKTLTDEPLSGEPLYFPAVETRSIKLIETQGDKHFNPDVEPDYADIPF